MTPHLLAWADEGLLTVDLDDGRRVLLVFAEPDPASAAAAAIAARAGRPVEVQALDLPWASLVDVVEVLLGGAEPGGLVLAPPDAPLHGAVLRALTGA